MRILFLCTDSYGGHGGIALYNRDLAGALSLVPGCEEVVVVPRIIVREPEPRPARVTFVADAARGKVAYLRAARRALRQNFDLVICGHTNLLPLTYGGPRPLLMAYGIEAWKPLRDPLSNRMLRDLRGLIAISRITCERFMSWSAFDGDAFLLPNAIRASDYGIRPKNPALVARYGLAGKRVLLTLGRIVAEERYKGFDEVLEVLPELAIEHPDLVYMIAGGGSDRERLERKARALGVAHRVIFTGFVAEAEKPDLYSLADLYVMPSRGEGFGFVFLEAMASGVPVIASRLDGGREAVLNGELGTLVDPSNPADLRIAIRDVLARGERRVPEGLSYFSFENFAGRVQEIVAAVR